MLETLRERLANWIAPKKNQAVQLDTDMSFSIQDVEDQIKGGMRECVRWADAQQALSLYRGEWRHFPRSQYSNAYEDRLNQRGILLLQHVVRILTADLYKSAPTRTITKSPDATKFLQSVYKQNNMTAKWMSADSLSMVAQASMWQVSGGVDSQPINIHLLDANSFEVFFEADDPLCPVAVVTRKTYKGRYHYDLWTAEEHREYIGDQVPRLNGNLTQNLFDAYGMSTASSGATLVKKEANPYQVLPFSWCHFTPPTTCFWAGSPGNALAETNLYVNRALEDLAGNIKFNMYPTIVASNIDPTWRPPQPLRPGEYLNPTAAKPISINDDVEDREPKLEWLQNDPGFVSAAWEDIGAYIDSALENCGVPPAQIRQVMHNSRSGTSIEAEHASILIWVKSRQQAFAHYEADLARLVLTVASAHYRNHDQESLARPLEKALETFELTVRWGDVALDLPGPSRDQADSWLLEKSLTTKLDILMRRYGFTAEEAEDYLKKLEDHKRIEESYAKVDTPIQAAFLTAGVMSKNEIRDYLGLPPEPDDDTEDLNNTLDRLKVLKAATDAGLPLDYACDLAGLPKPIVEPPEPLPDEVGTGPDLDQAEEETDKPIPGADGETDGDGTDGAEFTEDEDTREETDERRSDD